MSARYIVGDVFNVLGTLEPDSVDLVFTSPPFLGLRSYLPADHPDKDKEIGSEPTPADFLDVLLNVVEACDAVLAPHGSLCFELGDTFSGTGGATDTRDASLNGNDLAPRPSRNGRDSMDGWPLDKSLCLIPTLFAASLSYGYNMLRPERTTPRWRVRNLVVWARPNPPVGALGDKFRPATSYVTVACKSARRYFDLDAVRHPVTVEQNSFTNGPKSVGRSAGGVGGASGFGSFDVRVNANPAGAPPLDYWVIPTHAYPGAHYATFPPALAVKPVASMCPQRVCRVCGEPSRRITEPDEAYTAARGGGGDFSRHERGERDLAEGNAARGNVSGFTAQHNTLGWTDCGHDDWRAGVVLDPFAGSGTALSVATGHGRDAIGIDLDERNVELAVHRVGAMFLTVEGRAT